MDFDEYEYLEKTVENLEPQKSKGAANGDESVKSGERDRSRSLRHRSDSHDDLDHRGSDRHKDRGLSRHRSRSRDVERSERDRDHHRSSRKHRDRDKERDERNGKDRERDRHKDKDRDHERHRERNENDGEKEKERDRDRERDHDRRSRSHSEKRRDDRDGSQDRERIERELRERDRESRCARANSRWTFWHLSQTLGLRFWVINYLHRIVKSMLNLQLCLHVGEFWHLMSCYDFCHPSQNYVA